MTTETLRPAKGILWITWCEPFYQAARGERYDARVRPDEVKVAIGAFHDKGYETKILYLNKDMIPKLEKVVPEGIEIIEDNGVASWEIMGGVLPIKEKQVVTDPPNAPDTPLDENDPPLTPVTGKRIPPAKNTAQKTIKRSTMSNHEGNNVTPSINVTKRGAGMSLTAAAAAVMAPCLTFTNFELSKEWEKLAGEKKAELPVKHHNPVVIIPGVGVVALYDRIEQLKTLPPGEVLKQLTGEGYVTNRMTVYRKLNPKKKEDKENEPPSENQ